MWVAKQHQSADIVIKGSKIEQVEQIKYLTVKIHSIGNGEKVINAVNKINN